MPTAKPVLAITGLEGRDNPYPGVAIARALRAARGDDVVLVGFAYDPTLTGCQRSDLFDRVYLVPYPSDPPSTLRRCMLEIHEEFPLDGIIPALDSEVPIYALHREAFAARGIRMAIPPASSIKMRYKDRLESFCRSHAVACPRTEVVTDPYRFFDSGGWQFPAFVKGSLADAHYVTNRDEAIAACARVARKWGYPILVQEPVEGEELDVCAIARAGGETLALMVMKKIAISRAGKAVGGVILDDPRVEADARHIIECLKWEGPLELELVREASSGRHYMIEVNGRFPAWCAATAGAGLNMPDLLVRLLLREPIATPLPKPKAGTAFMRTSRTTVAPVTRLGDLLATGRLVNAR